MRYLEIYIDNTAKDWNREMFALGKMLRQSELKESMVKAGDTELKQTLFLAIYHFLAGYFVLNQEEDFILNELDEILENVTVGISDSQLMNVFSATSPKGRSAHLFLSLEDDSYEVL